MKGGYKSGSANFGKTVEYAASGFCIGTKNGVTETLKAKNWLWKMIQSSNIVTSMMKLKDKQINLLINVKLIHIIIFTFILLYIKYIINNSFKIIIIYFKSF